MSRSAVFTAAVDEWRTLREEFELLREAAFARAQDATNGAMLNARGRRAKIDPYSLFIGPTARAHAYASRELIDHWAAHPRVTYAQFERERVGTLWPVGGARYGR